METLRKDQTIQYLQHQISELQAQVDSAPSFVMGGDADITQKLLQLEGEVSSKKCEVDALRDEVRTDQYA